MNRFFIFLGICLHICFPSLGWSAPLKVGVTVPELGDIVRQVGGDEVVVTVFAKPGEDPHFVQAKPSFIRELSDADVFVVVGLELEIGWAPTLLEGARNPRIQRGSEGYLDASQAISPLEVPTSAIDRSLGDVHPYGNPHYLMDPIQGLRVARLIRDKFSTLRPSSRAAFADRYRIFSERVAEGLVGTELAKKYEIEKLAELSELGQLEHFLVTQGDQNKLRGWLAETQAVTPANVIADHNLWPYFAKRFGVTLVGFLEPRRGVPPSAAHLEQVVEDVKTKSVKAILSSAYYDTKHAEFVAQHTGIAIAPMAHQMGSRTGANDYLSFVDVNVKALVKALRASEEGK